MTEIIGLITDNLTDDEIIAQATVAEESKTVASFRLADAAKAIRTRHGEKGEAIEKLAKAVHKEPSTVNSYATWGSMYPHEVRDKRLSFNTYREAARLGDLRASHQLIRWASSQVDADEYEPQVFLAKRDAIKENLPLSDEQIDVILNTYGPLPPPKPQPYSKEVYSVVEAIADPSDVEQAIANLTAQTIQEWLRLVEQGIDISQVKIQHKVEFWSVNREN